MNKEFDINTYREELKNLISGYLNSKEDVDYLSLKIVKLNEEYYKDGVKNDL